MGVLILIFKRGLYSQPQSNTPPPPSQAQNSEEKDAEPKVISTAPSPLDEATILPNQTLEITFNQPLENVGEFKNRLEPKADYKVVLSDDRKTARIIPTQTFPLGTGFTLFILPDTKFDGKKTLGRDIQYHFKTINYQGV